MSDYKSEELPEFYNNFIDTYSKIRQAADLQNAAFLHNYARFARALLINLKAKQVSVLSILKATKPTYTSLLLFPSAIPVPFDLMESSIIPLCETYNKIAGEDNKFSIDIEAVKNAIQENKQIAESSYTSAR